VPRSVRQDRAMFDIDRTTARGGTSGIYDGQMFLCFDDWGPGGSSYTGSYLDVLSPAGAVLSELQLSGTGAVPFRGTQFQPVAGLNDGQIYFVSNQLINGGSSVAAQFHEFASAGAGTKSYTKSTIIWSPAGQRLGTSSHWGVNGHRIDERGYLAIDRTNGPRRGYLYFVTDRNPNPSDPTKDQGDLFLSISYTKGSLWETAPIPTSEGKTQFFPMIDVDDQGWIHVAYYQNETGPNGGALNASLANVFYTVSRDGGLTWAPPVRVNQLENSLELDAPPGDYGGTDFDLIGDYMQIHATGTGANTSTYVAWTGFKNWRTDDGVGNKRQRVYVTRLAAPVAPAALPGTVAGVALAMAALGALALRRRSAVRS